MKLIYSILSYLLLTHLSQLAAKPNCIIAEDVVVIYNSDIPESQKLAEFYQQQRNVPAINIIGFPMPNKDEISRSEFTSFKDTLNLAMIKNKLKEKRVLLLVRGVPFKVKRSGSSADEASLDSELSANADFSKLEGGITNHYFKRELVLKTFEQSFPDLRSLKLVTRIDGPSYQDCERIIRDSIATEKTGLWGVTYLDKAFKGKGHEAGDNALDSIERLNWINGIPTVKEKTKHTYPTDYPMADASVYFGWYTTHANGPLLHKDFKFKKGAIASHLHSFSASQLRSLTKNWVGPLIAKGACAVLGNAYEPFLSGVTQSDIFYQRLLSGFTFAEAAYMATPALSWQSIMIGDPLYTPFQHHQSMEGEIKEEDKDFRLMSILRKIHTGDDKKLLYSYRIKAAKLEKAKLYEYIALWNEYRKDSQSADMFYIAAGHLTQNESDKIRLCLHRSYLQLNTHSKALALQTLKDTLATFPDATHKRAVHSLQLMHDPPAPK